VVVVEEEGEAVAEDVVVGVGADRPHENVSRTTAAHVSASGHFELLLQYSWCIRPILTIRRGFLKGAEQEL